MNYEEMLNAMNEEFQGAEAIEAREPVDGVYKVTLIDYEVKVWDDGGMSLQYELSIDEGEYEGVRLWKKSALTPKAFPFLKKDLDVLGVKLAKLGDLIQESEKLVGTILSVKKVTKKGDNGKDFKNIYFQKVLGKSDVAEEAPPF